VPTTIARRFGANVKRIRKSREMTQEQLGLTAGLDAAVVSRIEAGQREPRVKNIVRIAKALDAEPGDLFSGL
jgi:transcriptional regulator with XRE-family HTH domain